MGKGCFWFIFVNFFIGCCVINEWEVWITFLIYLGIFVGLIIISYFKTRCPVCKGIEFEEETFELRRSEIFYKHENDEINPYRRVRYKTVETCKKCGYQRAKNYEETKSA